MISILIPVYNYNISNLITELNFQLSTVNIKYEIICVDDASEKYLNENRENSNMPNFTFISLKTNIGRSKIRNLLVKESKFDWLLFLDADVLPESKNFINNYIDFIRKNSIRVCCGGIVYQKNKPESNKLLRWVYGKNREEIDFNTRNSNLYRYFFAANILIHKSIFHKIIFNETIIKYGYEDVLFAHELGYFGIAVIHINNPIIHMGIEENEVFLNKTKEALVNLYYLNSENIIRSDSIRILKFFNKLKPLKLHLLLSFFYSHFYKILEYNLKSRKPSVLIFDIYKLSYFCFLNRRQL